MHIVSPNTSGIAEALEVLKAGGVVAHATETCYGLACDLRNPEAVKKLFAIKKRPANMPVSALFPSVEDAKKYVVWNDRAEEWAEKALPGPLTLILPMRADAPFALHPTADDSSKTIGVRVSPHSVALTLIEQFGSPLSTTSANIHGKPNPYAATDITTQFTNVSDTPDLIIDSSILPQTPPSKIVDLTGSEERTVRAG